MATRECFHRQHFFGFHRLRSARIASWLAISVATTVLSFASAGASTQQATQKAAEAAPAAAVPQVVIAVNMPSTDLQVTEMKYRVFYNKMEAKAIPLVDYDFAANLGDELASALSEDKRAQWRLAKPDEKEKLASFYGPKAWKQNSFPPPSLEADRVLLVGAVYGAFVHALVHNIEVDVSIRLADRKSGKILWKKGFREKMALPGKLEDMQAENQKVLKETLNKLMEQIVVKLKRHIAESQI